MGTIVGNGGQTFFSDFSAPNDPIRKKKSNFFFQKFDRPQFFGHFGPKDGRK